MYKEKKASQLTYLNKILKIYITNAEMKDYNILISGYSNSS